MKPLRPLLAALVAGTLFAFAAARLRQSPEALWAASLAAASGAATLLAAAAFFRAVGSTERAQQESRRAQEFFREFFTQAPVHFHSLDADGRYVQVNDTELRDLGYARDEMIGRPVHEFMSPESARVFQARFPAFKQRGFGSYDYEFRRRDGTTAVVRVRAIVVRDAAGRFLHTTSVGMNVTDQTAVLRRTRDHARQLEILNDALDQATRFKSEFLASQAHELRTPINAIIGFAELLRDEVFGPLNPKQADYIAEILQSGRHLVNLINNVMDLSRIEAGSLALRPEPLDLVGPLAEAMALLKQDAERRRIRLRATAVPGVIDVYADPDRLRQIFLNLISNGLRFTPEGGRVEVRAEPDGDWADIQVSDSGIGIAPDDQARVFAPFVQVSAPLDRARRGSGLGLTITKTLVELHGGSISLESRPGAGTTFTVRLPANRPTFEQITTEARALRETS